MRSAACRPSALSLRSLFLESAYQEEGPTTRSFFLPAFCRVPPTHATTTHARSPPSFVRSNPPDPCTSRLWRVCTSGDDGESASRRSALHGAVVW